MTMRYKIGIIEAGEAKGKVQCNLTRDTIMANANTRSRALEILTAGYRLTEDFLM